MIYAAAIAAIAALIGAAIASGDEAKARQIREDAAKKFQNIPLPKLDKDIAEQLPPEARERYAQSTQASRSQTDVMRHLGEEVDAKGETVDDTAAYMRANSNASGQVAGANSQLLRAMAARGLAGSGVESALMAQSDQGALDRGAQAGLDQAAQSRQRYQQALASLGQVSGQARSQDMEALKAQDAIDTFNMGERRRAREYNLGLPQQDFENNVQLTAAQANAQNGVAAGYDASGAKTRGTAAGLGNTAVTAAQAIEKKKRDDDFGQG